MKHCVLLAALLASGCSSDPTPESFRAFAQTEAERYGEKNDREAELLDIDLEKTDSITSPFAGTAHIRITRPMRWFDERIDGYETASVFTYDCAIRYGWRSDRRQWEFVRSDYREHEIRFPELPGKLESTLRKELKPLSGTTTDPTLAPHHVRSYATQTLAEWKSLYIRD